MKSQMKTLLLSLTAAMALSATGAAPSWADISVLGGSLETVAAVQVNAGDPNGSSNSDSPSVPVESNVTSYYVPATTSASDVAGALTASGTASILSRLRLNTSGFSLSFSGSTNAASNNPNGGSAEASGDLPFELVFTPSDSAPYKLGYNLSTQNLGCCGSSYSIYDDTTGQSVFYYTNYGSDTMGTLSGMLTAGNNYTLYINQEQYPFDEAATVSGAGSQTVDFDDEYRFVVGTPAVSAAPEPSVWALLIAGVGLSGFALRGGRRRGWAMA